MEIKIIKKKQTCIVCNGKLWYDLPSPSSTQSMTTSGVFNPEPLGKSQCCNCGLVQRTEFDYLGLTYFYETKYASYYSRPKQFDFNKSRYLELAEWVKKALPDITPNSILEVGCGQGWTLNAIKGIYPEARLEGVEPSETNSENARKLGLDVNSCKLDSFIPIDNRKYDLVFSNHVLQHTTNPIEFLQKCKQLLAEDGHIMITVQNSSYPSSELLYSDQNFSFLPYHLIELGNKIGLETVIHNESPQSDALLFSQIIVYRKAKNKLSENLKPSSSELNLLLNKKNSYLNLWKMLDNFLCYKIQGYDNVFNLGAGLFSYLLACYAPNYWNAVTACVVDDYEGTFLTKNVVDFKNIEKKYNDIIVLGVRPFIQDFLFEKVTQKGFECVKWNNFFSM